MAKRKNNEEDFEQEDEDFDSEDFDDFDEDIDEDSDLPEDELFDFERK